MIKNLTQIEHKIGDRTYHLVCDPSSPISEVKDAIFQFLKYVGQIEDNIRANQEAVKAAQAAQEPAQATPEPPKVEA